VKENMTALSGVTVTDNIKIVWVRGSDALKFDFPTRYFSLGIVGSGKSSFLESLGEEYLRNNATVLDLFGSRRGEGIAWLRSKWTNEKRILLLHGENVDLKCSHDAKNVSKLTLQDLESYDIIISATPLYISPSQEFTEVNKILDLLYKRLDWNRIVYGIVREASNIFYSRLSISKNQLQSKIEAIYLVRESRHMGMSLGLDSLKQTSVDIDMRILCDYQIIKALGIYGLPDELEWLYHIIDPKFIRNMKQREFIILSKNGAIGIGNFKEVPWHQKLKENILRAVGLKVEYGEEPVASEDRRTFKTISDTEHMEIMALYLDERQSMAKIQKLKNRSRSTIHTQITEHNEAVARSGFCPRCQRVHGNHAKESTRLEITEKV